jgi:hypothetical protein
MFLASPLSLSPLPRAVSGSQRPLQVWQERIAFPLRRDSRPGRWAKASHGLRRLLEQAPQEEGSALTKDTDPPQRHGDQGHETDHAVQPGLIECSVTLYSDLARTTIESGSAADARGS